MQDLSRDARIGAKAYLVPSSMNAGNTTSDDAELAMTAPGSVSVLPVPDKIDVLPLPEWSEGSQIPVSHPGQQEKTPVARPSNGGGGRWNDVRQASGRWTEAG